MATSPTSLAPEQQDRVRAAIRELRTKSENQDSLARLLRVKQQTISRVLSGGTVGVRLASEVARRRGQSLEELLEGRSAPRSFADLPGWHDAARQTIDQRAAGSHAVLAVSRWPAFLHVAGAEPRLILDLVALWTAWTPMEERLQAENEARGEARGSPTPAAGTLRVPSLSERRPRHG